MSQLTHEQFLKLRDMGREPISLPEEIWFSGNELLQKTPGRHHLKEFRETGTYNHPNLVAWRKRVATDRAKRLLKGKMSDVEYAKIGGMAGLRKALQEHGLDLDPDQQSVMEMNGDSLMSLATAKHQERSDEKRVELAKKGIAYEEIRAEQVNPNEDILKMAAEAASSKPGDNLASGDDEKLDGNAGVDAGDDLILKEI